MLNAFAYTIRQAARLAAAAIVLTAALPSWAIVTSDGKYVDKSGETHSWRISASHVLVWDEKPWVPVGGRFQASCWMPKATEADFDSDVAALKNLKDQGVTDVLLQPSRGGITQVPVERLQKLLDYLDSEGFTYGVSLSDGPQEPMLGYDVRPGKYLQVAPEAGGALRFPSTNTLSGLYFLASDQGELIQSGDATHVDEGLRVAVGAIPGRTIVYALPQKAHLSSSALGMPNVWEGFDTYRDTMMSQLRKVKWGKGLRFFVDALGSNLNPTQEAEAFVPSSVAFHTEFAEALARRYKSVEVLEDQWRVADREVKDFKDAAALVPLWGSGKGIQYFYNPTTGHQLRVETSTSSYWRDLNQFKTESLRGYMNDMATVLKKTIANVPVVYRSRGYSPLFADLPVGRGFDGIGVEAWGRGSDLVTKAAGYSYAQAAEADKTIWLPIVASGDAEPGTKTGVGYKSRIEMYNDLNWLRSIGARGFYVDGVHLTDPNRKSYDLSQAENQLQWLADYVRLLDEAKVATADPPKVMYYPRDLSLASLRPTANGEWWLPTERHGEFYDFGSAGRAYSLPEKDGTLTYYFWNPSGKKTIRIRIPKAPKGAPPIQVAASTNGNPEIKRDSVTITVGPDPVFLTGFRTVPVPIDAFSETLTEAAALTRTMRRRSQMDAGRFELQLAVLEKRYNADNPMPMLIELQRTLDEIRDLVRPYAWLEAENAQAHSFDMVTQKMGASGNHVLVVEPRGSGSTLPLAVYQVNVRTQGRYNVWVAASPNAPLSFRLDGTGLLDEATTARVVGEPYADGKLVWMRLGVATLPKGTHKLEMRSSGPATIDTVLLIQDDFMPNGAIPPPVKPDVKN